MKPDCGTGSDGEAAIIWDVPGPVPAAGEGRVYTWFGYEETDRIKSLLGYVEANAERLRGKYLAWVHELGMAQFEGKGMCEWLRLGDGSSYWEMTLLNEKSLFKSREAITDAVRLFALEEMLRAEKPVRLCLVSANKPLHQAIEGMARQLGMAYEWRRSDPRGQETGTSSWLSYCPREVLALGSLLRFAGRRWALRRPAPPQWAGDNQAIFLCTYFDNVSAAAAREGRFRSQYWGALHEHLQRAQLQTNWLHIFIPHQGVPTASVARDYLRRINAQPGEGAHAFADGYFSVAGLGRVMLAWARLCLLSLRLRRVGSIFMPRDGSFSLWPIMRGEWWDSLRGPAAINNLLQIELFDRALGEMPPQPKGLYVCENQPWELALVRAWRKHGHGQLTAVVHSAVRFWDLRYFTDPRTWSAAARQASPQPDRLAVPGAAAAAALLESGFPRERLVETEALRYTHLSMVQDRGMSGSRGAVRKILVLGDYLKSSTWRMMQLLEEASRLLPADIQYTVKPHPNMPVQPGDFPSFHFEVSHASLGELLAGHDCAYSSNMTAAAVDAHLGGLTTIVMLDARQLNSSALRGQQGVRFVSTATELAQALQAGQMANNGESRDREHLFHLDPKLPRWARFLKN